MRINKEIINKIKQHENDMFGFIADDLVIYLPFDKARQFLDRDYIEDVEVKNKKYEQQSQDKVIGVIRDYMNFALMKAEDHRSLSATRSIEHFKAWVWLLGDEDKIDWDNYRNYGVPILKQICQLYKITFPVDNSCLLNMSLGKKCRKDCDEGCN
jgi:hypothetical protein